MDFFLNKIPVVNSLKLREVVTLKVLYGNVTKTNDPSNKPICSDCQLRQTAPRLLIHLVKLHTLKEALSQ